MNYFLVFYYTPERTGNSNSCEVLSQEVRVVILSYTFNQPDAIIVICPKLMRGRVSLSVSGLLVEFVVLQLF